MRYFSIILFAILYYSCCPDKGLVMIHDKSWFPYKLESNIVYETQNGLMDSLSIAYLDSSNQWNHGDFCSGGYEEYRACTLKSNKFNDFGIQVSLDPDVLGFQINYLDRSTKLYYWTRYNKPSNDPHYVNLIDSIHIKNIVYHDILILSDSIKDYEIYYNRIGIFRYVIHKDTFDLKK